MKSSQSGAGGKSGDEKRSGGLDVGVVRTLAEVLTTFDLGEIEVRDGDVSIRLTRQTARAASAPVIVQDIAGTAAVAQRQAASSVVVVTAADNPGAVKSPMVGTVYRRPSPETKPLVEVGTQVKAGDRVLLVEAMKTFNDVMAHRAGTVIEILIEDGQPVEYGEPLLIID